MKYWLVLPCFYAAVICGYSYASSVAPNPKIENSLKDAKAVFIGVPTSEEPASAKAYKRINMRVTFRVTRKFKGDLGSTVEIYYLSDDAKAAPMSSERDIRSDMRPSFKYSIDHEISELVFVREINGILVTAPNFGGGTTALRHIQSQIGELEKLNTKSK
jgi:hypothetical protein